MSKRRAGTAKVSVAYLHPGELRACFHESLIDLLFYDMATARRCIHQHGKMGKWASSAGISDARNQLAQVMLDESVSDWLWMIDSDMGFAPDTLERLVAAADPDERPVVGGLCFAHKSDGKASFFGSRFRAVPTVYDYFEDDDTVGFLPRWDYERDAMQPVAATGAACVLVHRTVLERIREYVGDVWFDPINHPKGVRFSEDMSFCVRVAMCDFPMHIDTSIKTTHDKGGVFLDEEFYDTQQAAREMMGLPVEGLTRPG